ncbi:hypothetical protein [Sphingobacterium paludis]|uniref:DUF3592 domain-containing protein n=1 Tax=Sphingobacterium paludis TaxID=1476465 RepID=A0A4R7D294_9SPHI|nr:hypothetical protein [Sphingobacterium paludis]TDS14890.1 hypothetical protein B0I21_103391 [Sphingobacterium paludis]
MRKGFGIFWLLFFLYFIFAHPAIIYYNTEFRNTNLDLVNPNFALFNLALSFMLWAAVFTIAIWLILRYTVVAKRNLKKLLNTGKRLQGEIVEVKPLKSAHAKFKTQTIVLKLANLAGETIWHSMSFTDTKPEENRYQVGKMCYLRVDPKFETSPYVVLEESLVSVSWFLMVVWCMFLAAVLYYFTFSYDLENGGFGWRFLSTWHPLVVIPACIIFFPGIIFLILRYVVFKKMNIGPEATVLKFKGKRALASIGQIEQTGTSINDQPEVRFHVQFHDAHGNLHTPTIKKIVSLIDLGTIKNSKEKMLFYDPENPKRVVFEEDLMNERNIV